MLFAASVGFYDRGVADHYQVFTRLCEEGELVTAGGFHYLRWSVGEQLEVWTRVKDGKAEPVFQHYYAGQARMTLALVEKQPRQDLTLSDGAFLCRGCGFAGAGWVAGRNPFIFDTLDYHLYDGLSVPRLSAVHLTGFAFRIKGFADEDEYDEAYPADEDGFRWDYRHFIPALMIKQRGEGGELQPAQAEVSGYVSDTGLITNPVTGLDFSWTRLETIGGEIEVVCSPDRLSGYLVKGGVAVTECYLYGRLAQDDGPPTSTNEDVRDDGRPNS